jgi:hypothetical protein
MAPTYFDLRPLSGSLQLSLVNVILILKHSVRSCHNLYCVLCAVLCTAHNTHATPGHAATQLHNKLQRNPTECFNIDITLARLNCKLPDDGRRPKYVGAI